MFEIVEKRELAENIYLTRVKAPRIANSAKPGQFVIVRVKEGGERIPLTIADYDVEAAERGIIFIGRYTTCRPSLSSTKSSG